MVFSAILTVSTCLLCALWWHIHRPRRNGNLQNPPWQALRDQLSELMCFFGLVQDPVHVYAHLTRKYPGLSRAVTFSGPVVKVRGRDYIKAVMDREKDCLANGPGYPITIRELVGPNSLILLDGPVHVHKRKTVLHALRTSVLSAQLPACQSAAEAITQKWLKESGNGQWLRAHEHVQAMVSSVTASLLFGLPPSPTTEKLHTHVKAYADGMGCPIAVFTGLLFGTPLRLKGFQFDKGFIARQHIFDSITQGLDILTQRKENGESVEGEPNFLEFLLAERHLETGEPMSIEEMYLQILRLYPPVPALGRVATRDFIVGGMLVPEGTRVWVDVWAANRDPAQYPNPDMFRPERWRPSPTNPSPTPTPVLSFGRGSHLCVGRTFANLLMPTLLAAMIRTVNWFVPTNQNLKPSMLMVFHPSDEAVIGLKSRVV